MRKHPRERRNKPGQSLGINDMHINIIEYSSLAQSVEHAAVNRRVVGSSPTGGARNRGQFRCHLNCPIFMRFLSIFEEIRVSRVENMVNIAIYNKSKYNKNNNILPGDE